ncbi:MAG: hypothetical protein QCI38_08090, partial [Candidatus Thermoplasmatota archaeon]|nr:hypothetical protein [Candidatus Thermoplasmatota archaeon]
YTFLFAGSQGSPEAAVNTFVDKFNSRDIEGMIAVTMIHFAGQDIRDNMAAEGRRQWPLPSIQIRVSGMSVTYRDQMSADEGDYVDGMKEAYQLLYNVTIVDSAVVKGTMEEISDGAIINSSSYATVTFKVGENWYIHWVPV